MNSLTTWRAIINKGDSLKNCSNRRYASWIAWHLAISWNSDCKIRFCNRCISDSDSAMEVGRIYTHYSVNDKMMESVKKYSVNWIRIQTRLMERIRFSIIFNGKTVNIQFLQKAIHADYGFVTGILTKTDMWSNVFPKDSKSFAELLLVMTSGSMSFFPVFYLPLFLFYWNDTMMFDLLNSPRLGNKKVRWEWRRGFV